MTGASTPPAQTGSCLNEKNARMRRPSANSKAPLRFQLAAGYDVTPTKPSTARPAIRVLSWRKKFKASLLPLYRKHAGMQLRANFSYQIAASRQRRLALGKWRKTSIGSVSLGQQRRQDSGANTLSHAPTHRTVRIAAPEGAACARERTQRHTPTHTQAGTPPSSMP
jgi:hypothetical protein